MRACPSCPLSLRENESSCETIHMKMDQFILFVRSFSCKSNSFSPRKFRTMTRFETEAKGSRGKCQDSEMACSLPCTLYVVAIG